MQLISEDDLDELTLDGEPRSGEDQAAYHRRISETAVGWATQPGEFTLTPPVRGAHLILVAAEHLQLAGDLDGALRLAEQGGAHPDAEPSEAIPTLVDILLERGDREAALAMLEEYRRSGAVSAEVVTLLADVLSTAAEIDDATLAVLAERRATIAVREIENTDGAVYLHDVALGARFRARRLQEKPLDGLDEEYLDYLDDLEDEDG